MDTDFKKQNSQIAGELDGLNAFKPVAFSYKRLASHFPIFLVSLFNPLRSSVVKSAFRRSAIALATVGFLAVNPLFSASFTSFDVVQTSGVAGQNIQLNANLHNPDGYISNGLIRFYLTKNAVIGDADDVYVTETGTFGVNNGNNPINNLSIPLGWPYESGSYYLGAHFIVNGNNGQDAKSYDTIYVALPGPDFIAYDGRPQQPNFFFDVKNPGDLQWGDPLDLKYLIFNQGGTGTLPSIQFVLSKNNIIGDSDDRPFYSLAANQEIKSREFSGSDQYLSISLPKDNPYFDEETEFYVAMVIDPDKKSLDTDRKNNFNQGIGKDLSATKIKILSRLPRLRLVEGGNTIRVESNILLNYDEVVVDGPLKSLVTKQLSLSNMGSFPLRISDISLLEGKNFKIRKIASATQQVTPNPLDPPFIEPFSTQPWTVEIDFDPLTIDQFEDTLRISSNDPDRPEILIHLTGVGAEATTLRPFTPFTGYDSGSNWWVNNSLIDFSSYSTLNDDFAAVQGQVKNYARAAFDAMEARLPTGAGFAIKNLVAGWSYTDSHNDTAINLGQLKNVAQPFYDRLIELGLAATYPWSNTTADDDDFHAATIGQLKTVFAFPIPTSTLQVDSDGDGLPDTWERAFFGDLSRDGNGDFDGDGLTDKEEYASRTDPTNKDSDGDGISDQVEIASNLNPLANDGALDKDGDGIPNDQDLDPANASIGALTIQIITPINGSTVP